jgi:hypothetical protein
MPYNVCTDHQPRHVFCVLNAQQENPQSAQTALKDPVIAERIQKLAAAGILSFG